MTYKFKKGDRFRFIRDNSDGGAKFGRKGEEFELVEIFGATRFRFSHPDWSWLVNVRAEDIELAEPEKPKAPVKATLYVSVKEIEELVTDLLEKKLGIKTKGAAVMVLSGRSEVAVEAEIKAVA